MSETPSSHRPSADAATARAVARALRAVEEIVRAHGQQQRSPDAWQAWETALATGLDAAPAIAVELARRAVGWAKQAVKEHRRDPLGQHALAAVQRTLAVLEDAYVPGVFDYAARARAAEQVRLAIHATSEFSWKYHRRDPSANAPWLSIVWCNRAALHAAYPPGFWESVGRLRARDPAGLEVAVVFLEADPWFHRSGYAKESLLAAIGRLTLPPDYAERLRRVLVTVVDSRDRREFRRYCRLARRIDTPSLRDALRQRLEHDDAGVRRRAGWMLGYLDGRPAPPGWLALRRSSIGRPGQPRPTDAS